MQRPRPWTGSLILATVLMTAALPLRAALTNVNILGLSFSPQVVTINANDQVKWTWVTTFHSTTSTNSPPLWDSTLITTNGYVFTNTFPNAGGFGYLCTFHGFTGTVIVKAVNLPPAVTLTNPPNGVTLSAPASLVLGASATDTDGSVTNVQFLQGAVALGNDSSNPYSMNVSSLAAGDYTFFAVASDNVGARATNSIVVHVVTPVSIVLSAPVRSVTDFHFDYSANAGLNYIVQRSSDLFNWVSLATNMASGSPVTFTDTTASDTNSFYRVSLVPNP